MKEILRNSLKTALIFGVIGITVSLLVPPLVGVVMGSAAGTFGVVSAGHTLATALTFGFFGLLEPIVKPFGFIFGNDEAKKSSCAGEQEPGKQRGVVIRLSPERAEQPTIRWMKQIGDERSAAEQSPQSDAAAQR